MRTLLCLLFASAVFSLSESYATDPGKLISVQQLQQTLVLSRTPPNNGKNCLGIAAVSEALADMTQRSPRATADADELARNIFRSLSSDSPPTIPGKVDLGTQDLTVDDPRTIRELSRLVGAHYRSCFVQREGAGQTPTTPTAIDPPSIATLDELEAILSADSDRLELFCGFGVRHLPSGAVSESNHAFLIGKLPTGEKVIYDSNDPGRPLPCQFHESGNSLVVSWSCWHPGAGAVTRQRYRVVTAKSYFANSFAPPAADDLPVLQNSPQNTPASGSFVR